MKLMIGYSEAEVEALGDAITIMRQKRFILKCDCDWSRMATVDKHIVTMSGLYENAVESRKIQNDC